MSNDGQPGDGVEADQRLRDQSVAFTVISIVLFAVVACGTIRLWTGSQNAGGRVEVAGLRIDINHADVATLELLPGIGPTVASRIVEEREAGGHFKDVDDVARRVKGVGPKLSERMRPYVVFGTGTSVSESSGSLR